MGADPPTAGDTYNPINPHVLLRPKSKAVDAGERIPNINDNAAGSAPDLGAYEGDQPRPTYGPRPVSKDGA